MKITDQAIAYLKGSLPDNGLPPIKLAWEEEPVIRSLFNGLHVCYLVEGNDGYQYIQNRNLKEDGITAEDLHRIGLRNLKDRFVQKNAKVQPHGNIFAFLAGGDFEASVLLLDEFWEAKFHEFVKGEYAAAMPSRDVFAFCDANSKESVVELQQVINRIWSSGDHLISGQIYIRQPTGWKSLD